MGNCSVLKSKLFCSEAAREAHISEQIALELIRGRIANRRKMGLNLPVDRRQRLRTEGSEGSARRCFGLLENAGNIRASRRQIKLK